MEKYSLFHHISVVTNSKKIWYYADLIGYIMEIDVVSGEMKCLFAIHENNNEPFCRNLFYHDGKLYMLPYASKIMYVYDLAMGKILNTVKFDSNVSACRFTGCIYRKGSLYLYGALPQICIYNIKEEKMHWKQLMFDELGMSYNPASWFWTESFQYKEDIFLLISGSNGLIKISNDDRFSYIPIGTNQQALILRDFDLIGDEIEELYLDKDYNVLCRRYNRQGCIKNICELRVSYQWSIYPYSCAEHVKNQWILFPYKTNSIMIFDLKKESIERLYTIGNTIDIQGKYYFGNSIKDGNNNIFAINQIDGTLVIVSADTMKVKEIPLYFSSESLNEFHSIIVDRVFENNGTIHEIDGLITLDVLIKGLNQK